MSETPEHVDNSMTVDDPPKKPARLPGQIQAFIVRALACYDSPTEVARAVKEEFDVDVTRFHVQTYNPERGGNKPAKRWCALFEQTRAAFEKNVSDIPIAKKATRLRALHRMAQRAEVMGNYALAKELHEQAAKEMGDVYTNRRLFDIDPEGTLADVLGIDPSKLPTPDGGDGGAA
jgi:hypothetical protein